MHLAPVISDSFVVPSGSVVLRCIKMPHLVLGLLRFESSWGLCLFIMKEILGIHGSLFHSRLAVALGYKAINDP